MILPRQHRTGLFLAGLVMAAPLLASGAAVADVTTVTFSGEPLPGSSTLVCPSTPSQTTLTVTAGSTVDFVNRTGRTATLWAGESQKDLPDKSLVPVMFTQGPATVVVQMLPKCSLDLGKHIQMTVNVLAATGSSSSPPTVGGTVPGGPTAGATPRSGSGTEHATPASHSPGAAAPTSNASGGGNDPFQAAPASAAKSTVFGAERGTRRPRSASGLLTLVATVGVVGVAAAAIRAILAQRASQALMA